MEEFTHEDLRVDLIQRFLSEDLGDEEKEDVERRIKTDPVFAQEVEKYRFLLEGFWTLEAEQFRAKVKSWDVPAETKNTSFGIRRWSMAVAATITLLIGGFLVFQWLAPTQPPTQQEFFAQAMTDYVPNLSLRGREGEDGLKLDLYDAFDQYSAKNYPAAILKFQEWIRVVTPQEAPDDERNNALLCLGVSQIRGEKLQDAVQTFSAISESSVYSQHARWYEALALLKLGDIPKTQEKLETLREDPFYKERALKILNQL